MFRRIILFSLAIALFGFLLPLRSVHAEQIESYVVNAQVRKDGKVDIVETITYSFGNEERHGIFRTIPTLKINKEGKKFRLTFDNISVEDSSGKTYMYTRSNTARDLTLKIGDPDLLITGIHTYVISYQVSGAITYFSDHDEFYWNVTGNEWNVPIEKVQFSVLFPPEVNTGMIQAYCYTGLAGSTSSDCNTSVNETGTSVTSVGSLNSYSGLTASVNFPRDVVTVLEPQEVTEFFDTPVGAIVGMLIFVALLVGGLIWYLILPCYIVYLWWKNGRDPKPPMGVAHAWFSPPQDKKGRALVPGETGALTDEQVDLRDISATIVDLARRGYITILETEKSKFSFEKKQDIPKNDVLLPFEKELVDGIFATGDVVPVKGTDFSKTVLAVNKKLYEQVVTDGFFAQNPEKQRVKYYVLGVLAFMTGNILLTIIAFVFGRSMPKKTLLGAQQASIGLALRNFLRSQDNFLTFQAKNQLFFEKLLPYAVAFGVEKIWADRFRDVHMKQPDWYRGQQTHFTSYAFIRSLDSSFTTFYRSATPTSSSSGFSSGSSGGFSGGGGGGGGGGSW